MNMHPNFSLQHPARPFSKARLRLGFRPGFSMIELLAVISIMAILLSIGAIGIRNVGKAQGTTAGAAVVEALMEEARTIAVSRGTTARLIINNIPNDDLSETKYLREMYVVYRDIDEDTGEQKTDKWIRASRATFLPDKVYFDEVASKASFAENAGEGSKSNLGPELHPLDGGNPSSIDAYYYEFNSEGICQTPGASFVCVEGAMVNNEIKGDKENKAGFVVWRNGRTSVIRDFDSL